jgi:hypothetical protein
MHLSKGCNMDSSLATATSDLRRAPRQQTRDLAIITLGSSTHVPAGDSFPIQLHDLSMRGARFTGRVPLQRGDHFILYLPPAAGRVTMLATAVHIVDAEDGYCTVGAEFSCLLRPQMRDETPACLEEAELSRIRAMMLDD